MQQSTIDALGAHKEQIENWRKQGLGRNIIHERLVALGCNVSQPTVGRYFKVIETPPNKFSDTLAEHGFEAPHNWQHGWVKTKGATVFVKNQNTEDEYETLKADFLEYVKQHSPKYPTIERSSFTDGHLLVVDPCDIHVGKLATTFETGEDYNSQIAVQRVREGVNGIIAKSNPYNIEKVLFIAGNDILHTDTPNRTTTKGTPQDTDGMWYENFLSAKKILIECIEMLMNVADVHVVFNPSNHDFMSGFFLLDSVQSWFSKCNNVTFDADMRHRKYFRFYDNLIGTTHGDGARQAELPLLMAQEAGADWLAPKRYIYGHHIHHKVSKDYGSVCFEAMRSASGTDSYHHRHGYDHSPKAIEGFVHDKYHGQVTRITHYF